MAFLSTVASEMPLRPPISNPDSERSYGADIWLLPFDPGNLVRFQLACLVFASTMTHRNAPAVRPGLPTFLLLFLRVWNRNQSCVICSGLLCFRQNVANAYTD